MILHITRHGQVLPPTACEVEDTRFPKGDRLLSDLGQRQARSLGQRLADTGFAGRIYSSPYRRTVQTASLIAAHVDQQVEPCQPFREIVMHPLADFRGRTIQELHHEFDRVDPNVDLPHPWWVDGVETVDQVEARVLPLVESLLEQNQDALLVGHGATTGAARRIMMKKFLPQLLSEPAIGWNCHLTTFQIQAGKARLVHLCCTDHLGDDEVTSNAATAAEVLAKMP